MAETMKPVAFGMPNTAITGRGIALMMVKLQVPSDDQYGGALWVPLFTADQLAQARREEREKILKHFRATADSHYVRGLEFARADGCLGAEYKMSNGKFNNDCLQAHKKFEREMGAHYAMHAAIRALPMEGE